MKWSLSLLVLVTAFTVSSGGALGGALGCAHSCTRECASWLIPKLDLTCSLSRTRREGATLGTASSDHVRVGVAAWLRWQPSIAASSVPERFELSPSAWLVPCEADDVTCVADYAEEEPEVAAELRAAP